MAHRVVLVGSIPTHCRRKPRWDDASSIFKFVDTPRGIDKFSQVKKKGSSILSFGAKFLSIVYSVRRLLRQLWDETQFKTIFNSHDFCQYDKMNVNI